MIGFSTHTDELSMSTTATETPTPPKKRRWLSIGVRGLLVLILVASLALAWFTYGARTQKRAVETLRAAKARLT